MSENIENEQSANTELLEKITEVADKITLMRQEKGGVLPKELWLELLRISGSYLCTELLLVTPDGSPVLKVRNDPTPVGREQEWEGKLHLPGIVVGTATRGNEVVTKLLEKEVVNKGEHDLAEQLSKSAVFFGFVREDEPERKTIADSLVLTLVIDPKDPRFQQDLVVLTDDLKKDVIPEHQPVIERFYENPKGGVFMDTRPSEK